jgi:AcrR family transcriptional regulator
MGRLKTISDDEVLRVARDFFRAQGHTATTRAIAQAAGISEAVLYQRFGSKNQLFFAAMHALGPDIEELLGPKEPAGDAHAYLTATVARLGNYFADVLPLALRVITHPSFDPATLAHFRGPAALQEGLAERLSSLARRKKVAPTATGPAARLLVSLAHDWALIGVLAHASHPHRDRQLKEMVDVVWEGLRRR